jgi:hypothetical protein
MPGVYVNPDDMPTAPSASPAATSERILSISDGVAGRASQPTASIRTVPCGTRYAAFTAMPSSSRSRYSPTLRQLQSNPAGSSFQPASCVRRVASVSSSTGAYDNPSCPSTSSVTPCDTLARWAGFASTWRSECECMSMNPGASTRPSASITRPAPPKPMRPSWTDTSAR